MQFYMAPIYAVTRATQIDDLRIDELQIDYLDHLHIDNIQIDNLQIYHWLKDHVQIYHLDPNLSL